jgi:hypothetical protein
MRKSVKPYDVFGNITASHGITQNKVGQRAAVVPVHNEFIVQLNKKAAGTSWPRSVYAKHRARPDRAFPCSERLHCHVPRALRMSRVDRDYPHKNNEPKMGVVAIGVNRYTRAADPQCRRGF